MEAWWTGLNTLNQGLYVVAIFFSTLFLWQFIAALVGLSGDMDADLRDAGPEVDDGFHEGGLAAFKLLSIRSIIAFGMLFGWAGALYLESGMEVQDAFLYGLVWGAAGMVIVAYFFRSIQRLTETGNAQLETCIGISGEVYLDIPESGTGQVRVTESGAITYVSARGKDGTAIASKTPVRVLRTVNPTTVEVEPIDA